MKTRSNLLLPEGNGKQSFRGQFFQSFQIKNTVYFYCVKNASGVW